MPNTPNIQLDVRNFASNQPGWYNVQSSSNQPYSYSYTGGDDGVGGLVQTVGQGRDTAPIQLSADQRYRIGACQFANDDQHQLTWSGGGNRAGAIIDANTQIETAKYSIVVTDTGNGNCTIVCDPGVTNKPQ
jgi:hypothetical protein